MGSKWYASPNNDKKGKTKLPNLGLELNTSPLPVMIVRLPGPGPLVTWPQINFPVKTMCIDLIQEQSLTILACGILKSFVVSNTHARLYDA